MQHCVPFAKPFVLRPNGRQRRQEKRDEIEAEWMDNQEETIAYLIAQMNEDRKDTNEMLQLLEKERDLLETHRSLIWAAAAKRGREENVLTFADAAVRCCCNHSVLTQHGVAGADEVSVYGLSQHLIGFGGASMVHQTEMELGPAIGAGQPDKIGFAACWKAQGQSEAYRVAAKASATGDKPMGPATATPPPLFVPVGPTLDKWCSKKDFRGSKHMAEALLIAMESLVRRYTKLYASHQMLWAESSEIAEYLWQGGRTWLYHDDITGLYILDFEALAMWANLNIKFRKNWRYGNGSDAAGKFNLAEGKGLQAITFGPNCMGKQVPYVVSKDTPGFHAMVFNAFRVSMISCLRPRTLPFECLPSPSRAVPLPPSLPSNYPFLNHR